MLAKIVWIDARQRHALSEPGNISGGYRWRHCNDTARTISLRQRRMYWTSSDGARMRGAAYNDGVEPMDDERLDDTLP